MSWLENILSSIPEIGDDADRLRWLLLLGLGLGSFLAALGLSAILKWFFDPVRQRVSRVGGRAAMPSRQARNNLLIERLGRDLVPKDAKKRGKTEEKLIHAGFRQPTALARFYGLKIVAIMLISPVAALLLFGVAKGDLATAVQYGMALGLIGFLAPDFVLVKLVKKRQHRVRRGLPDALDFLVICGEAGLGLNASLDRVAREMDIQHPELASEFATVTAEMRAGLDIQFAMRGLVERTGLGEMKSLVATLLQAMRFGTSIAGALRVYAEELRDKRLQAVEELAAKLEVKMLLPIAALIMPGFMLVAIGPSVLQLAAAFKNLGG
jgi:tight adherence protein C